MEIFRRMTRLLPIVLFSLMAFPGHIGVWVSHASAGSNAGALPDEARALMQIERTYYAERTASDWKAIYARQHPNFREKITYEQFVNERGQVAFKSDDPEGRLLLGTKFTLPPIKHMVTTQRDMLGFPVQPRYRIIPNPWITIDKTEYRALSISEDGRFAKVEINFKVTERLPPALFKVNMVIPHERKHTDYWEKVDGKWVVALLAQKTTISGVPIEGTFIPNNIENLDRMEWHTYDPKTLAPVRDAMKKEQEQK